MKIFNRLLLAFVAVGSIACTQNSGFQKTVTIGNPNAFTAESETVVLTTTSLGITGGETTLEQLVVKDNSGKVLLSQTIDLDADSIADQLIFQTDIAAESSVSFVVAQKTEADVIPEAPTSTFARIAPERIDDFAWENDRIAFRMYGPEAKRLKEIGDKAGIISSGIDCWLKRAEYPIINKWYAKHVKGGSYHKDSGDGLDNYHVGVSRGCGGLRVQVADSQYMSPNYVHHHVIANGPIRTVFKLDFGTWKAGENKVTESKLFTIDLGSSFYKIDVTINGADEVAAGITVHEKLGASHTVRPDGWVRYWEPLDDSHLGTALVTAKGDCIGVSEELSEVKDESHLWLKMKVTNNKFTYYAGYGWAKAKYFNTSDDWDAYVANFATKINTPATVTIK